MDTCFFIRPKDIIYKFLEALEENLRKFRPIFLFTDEGRGQVTVTVPIINITPFICLWHILGATGKKSDRYIGIQIGKGKNVRIVGDQRSIG